MKTSFSANGPQAMSANLEHHFCHKHEIYTIDDPRGHPILWVCEHCHDAKLAKWERQQEQRNDDDRSRA